MAIKAGAGICALMSTQPSSATRAIGSVFEMSHQSNFRNRAVVEKVGVRYRPNRHGDPRDTQIPALAPASLAGALSA
jgi:hypothetical protein